jgi:hypothetical protein
MNEGQLRFGSSGGGGGSSVYAPPEQWAYANLTAGLVSTPLSAQVSGDYDDIPEIRAGSVVGLSVRLTTPITAGTVTVRLTINGAPVGLSLTMTSVLHPSGGVITQAPLLDTYTAGQVLGLVVTTSGDFATSGPVDLEAYLETSTPGGGPGPGPGSPFLTVDPSTQIVNFTPTPGFVYLLDNPGKGAQVLLPTAASVGATGVVAWRVVYDSNGWTVLPNGSDTIDGQPFMPPGQLGSFGVLMSDGVSNWVPISTNRSFLVQQDGVAIGTPPAWFRGLNVASPLVVSDEGDGRAVLSLPPPTYSSTAFQLIYAPGTGNTGPAAFASWSSLFSQIGSIQSFISDATFEVIIDDSTTSPAVPDAGAYDLRNVALKGRDVATAFHINDGTTFANLTHVTHNLNITVTGLGPTILYNDVSWTLRVDDNASITTTGGGPFLRSFSTAFEPTYLIIDGGRLMTGTYEIIEMLGGGSTGLQVYLRAHPWDTANGTQLGDNTLRGNAGATATIFAEPNVSVSELQTNMVNPVSLTTTMDRVGVFATTGGGVPSTISCNDGYLNIVQTFVAAATNIRLGPAYNNRGVRTTIKSSHLSLSTLTAVPTGADTINGAASLLIGNANNSMTFVSDGVSNWEVVAST